MSTDNDRAEIVAMVDPVALSAEVMARASMTTGLESQVVNARGAILVVEAPGTEWVSPLSSALLSHISRLENSDGPVDDLAEYGEARASVWVVLDWEGAKSQPSSSLAHWLSSGRNVLAVSSCLRRQVPERLLRCADWTISVPSMSSAVLVEIAKAMTGGKAKVALPDAMCRLIGPEDLQMAYRSGEDADSFLRRLMRLVGPKLPQAEFTLSNLYGMDAAVSWGRSLAVDLKEFMAGRLPWSAVDRGVLLTGPPGTGKTTFAQALAGSCGVPLVAGSLAQWQAAGHLGDLLKAMRASFDQARRAAPSILFIDEIDAFGDRASFATDHRDYGVQVVNGLLEELDGVTGRDGVVVVGACNLPERLDKALLRSGRLDRVVHIPLPDSQALANILRHWLGSELADADLSFAATMALGSTGADCERWVRGARRRARTVGREMVIDDLVAEIRGLGDERPPETLRRSAVHEAGHAVALAVLRPGALVGATVRRTRNTGGGVMSISDEEPCVRGDIVVRIQILLAGRAAEELILGCPSNGAGGDERSDLARATLLSMAMVTAYGLEPGQLIWSGMPDQDTLEMALRWRPEVERMVSGILSDAYSDVLDLLRTKRPAVEAVANLLALREAVTGSEIEAVVDASNSNSNRLRTRET